MNIDSTTAAAAAANAAASTTAPKKDPLGRDAFLSLLVAQLQHQDPTSPQPDGAFLAQLAQFSSLEQLQTANQTLAQIASVFATLDPSASAAATATTTTSSATTPKQGQA
jgi:flagellar basal-body rod modification protein FlgD